MFFLALREVTLAKETLKSLVRDGAMLCAVPLSIWAENPSGPLAFDGSRDIYYEKDNFLSCSYRGAHLGMNWNAEYDDHHL